jgi:hypothetical protein
MIERAQTFIVLATLTLATLCEPHAGERTKSANERCEPHADNCRRPRHAAIMARTSAEPSGNRTLPLAREVDPAELAGDSPW